MSYNSHSRGSEALLRFPKGLLCILGLIDSIHCSNALLCQAYCNNATSCCSCSKLNYDWSIGGQTHSPQHNWKFFTSLLYKTDRIHVAVWLFNYRSQKMWNTKQIEFMFQCDFSITDHRRCENVVRTFSYTQQCQVLHSLFVQSNLDYRDFFLWSQFFMNIN